MIRCLCTGAAPIARLLRPLEMSTDWPEGVASFLAGDTMPYSTTPPRHEDRGGEPRKTPEASIFR